MGKPIIMVAGALANKVGNGGGAWERMSWVIGLGRLGFDVHFIEQIAPQACRNDRGDVTGISSSFNLDWFREVSRWFEVEDRATLVSTSGERGMGMAWAEVLNIAERAELLVNLSGHLTLEPLLERIRRKAYIDVDPGFTQFWLDDASTGFTIRPHEFYFTIGENIGREDCSIPSGGIRWRAIRQPVVLSQWPTMRQELFSRFTTIASWRGSFGPIQANGQTYGLKAHEFRKFLELPHAITEVFEIALDIHAADGKDRTALENNGWRIQDPRKVACDPDSFRRYVQGSGAEFSVAQGVYVATNSGWFSDRSLRYLASGKPVLVQETGFSRNYPVGEGIVPFRTGDEAAAGAADIVRNYDHHCRAARLLAEAYFDSDKVLGRMLEEVGIGVPKPAGVSQSV